MPVRVGDSESARLPSARRARSGVRVGLAMPPAALPPRLGCPGPVGLHGVCHSAIRTRRLITGLATRRNGEVSLVLDGGRFEPTPTPCRRLDVCTSTCDPLARELSRRRCVEWRRQNRESGSASHVVACNRIGFPLRLHPPPPWRRSFYVSPELDLGRVAAFEVSELSLKSVIESPFR